MIYALQFAHEFDGRFKEAYVDVLLRILLACVADKGLKL